MGKLFGIVSQKIITNDKIDKLKNNIFQNNLREDSIFKSNDKKIFLYNENLCVINLSKLTHDNNSLIILIDGETYNCDEIAKDLINRGCELIKNGEDGILVPPENPKVLAGAINSLLENEELRKKLSQTAYKKVREKYSIDTYSVHMLDFYKSLV